MAVSISAASLPGIAVFASFRGGSVRLWPGQARTTFGCIFASSGAGPALTTAISTVTGRISSL
ncbi:hypothetical protein ACFVVP_39270 [Streptomyces sp. NPDC058128]|uniref:hypothetical protein n=1 Tax=Streptomyces sp. NPDC058128 TaxID=3346352 RepID=UPI0036F17B20